MPEEKRFTDSDFMTLIEMFGDKMGDKFIEAIKEMKKLPPHEQMKLDEKLAREAEHRRQRMGEAIADQRQKEEREFRCSHIKQAEGVYSRQHAFRGQMNSDRHFRPVCVRCFKQFPKIRATDQQAMGGLGLHNIPNLTAEAILEWHMKTVPNCKDCAAGACAVKDLRQLRTGRLDPIPEVLPDGKIRAAEAAVA